MTKRDMGWLWAIAGAAIAIAIWVGMAYAQTGLVVPDDMDIGDDLTVADHSEFDGTTNTDGVATLSHHSSSFLPQRYIVQFDESSWTNKAYPDTFTGMPMRTLIYAPTDGLVYDVYFAVETAGSGWDSLLIDLFAGTSADSTMLTTLPQITPAVGDKSNTLTEGRQAVMSSTMRQVDAGEHIRIWGRVYGSHADPPTGLKAWIVFQPDYGN